MAESLDIALPLQTAPQTLSIWSPISALHDTCLFEPIFFLPSPSHLSSFTSEQDVSAEGTLGSIPLVQRTPSSCPPTGPDLIRINASVSALPPSQAWELPGSSGPTPRGLLTSSSLLGERDTSDLHPWAFGPSPSPTWSKLCGFPST